VRKITHGSFSAEAQIPRLRRSGRLGAPDRVTRTGVSAPGEGVPDGMTESPADPVHDDHGPESGENPDGTHDQDAEPPTPTGEMPDPDESGVEHPDPPVPGT